MFCHAPDRELLLTDALLERVLSQLGFSNPPAPAFDGLCRIYSAWCQKVPFDNVRKLIHVRSGHSGPLPGYTPADFLEAWLKFGTGGTCWSGAGALHAVLSSLGFDAYRGIGTMMAAPELPPNHGTVMVRFDQKRYLVDSGILHGEPLLLQEDAETVISHPAWGIRCAKRDGRWHIQWRPFHRLDGFECRLERFGALLQEYQQMHDKTRGWSPFNFQVTARINRGDRTVGIGFGKAVTLESDGLATERPVSMDERNAVLIETVGISEEIVSLLPDDIPTPPPPGSRTAQLEAAAR